MNIDADVQLLLHSTRVGVLVTLGNEGPVGSAVPFLICEGWQELLVHLSTLAAHTQNLLQDPRLSLFLMEPDHPQKNPLALKRFNLQGSGSRVDPQSPTYEVLARRFIDRFPEARMTMSLADFQLWQLQMHRAQFIAGFGQAYTAEASAPTTWLQQRRREANP
ncbi:MAG: hypothetical protein C4293_03430 [Nitrospiraceae bacterium]